MIYKYHGCTSVTLNSNAIASATYSSSQNIGTMFDSQVKNYMFGDEVKRIGEYAFASSKEVVSIVLERNIERLQDNAFSGCDKLEEVRVRASEPPIAFSTAFPDNAYYAFLYVPEGTEALYKEDNVWGKFARIRTFKVDVTGKISDDSYTTPLLEGDAELSVVFEMDED